MHSRYVFYLTTLSYERRILWKVTNMRSLFDIKYYFLSYTYSDITTSRRRLKSFHFSMCFKLELLCFSARRSRSITANLYLFSVFSVKFWRRLSSIFYQKLTCFLLRFILSRGTFFFIFSTILSYKFSKLYLLASFFYFNFSAGVLLIARESGCGKVTWTSIVVGIVVAWTEK